MLQAVGAWVQNPAAGASLFCKLARILCQSVDFRGYVNRKTFDRKAPTFKLRCGFLGCLWGGGGFFLISGPRLKYLDYFTVTS